jgi:hypothetical protein
VTQIDSQDRTNTDTNSSPVIAPERSAHKLVRVISRLSSASSLPLVITVSGIILFACLSLIYTDYYRRFNLIPSDIGLGYVDVLSRSWGMLLLVLLLLILTLPTYWYLRLLNRLMTGNPAAGAGVPIPQIIGLIIVASPVIFGIVRFNESISTRVAHVKEGESASPIRWGPLTLLDIRADKATITHIEGKRLAIDPSHKLLYLGQNAGSSILYDATAESVIRVPTDVVVVTVAAN